MSYFNDPQPIGANQNPLMDPNTYAQKYAAENGIDLEQAKNELRAKYGDPQKPNSTFAPVPQNIPKGAIGPVFGYMNGTSYSYNTNDFKGLSPAEMKNVVAHIAKENNMTPQGFAQLIGLPPREKSLEDKTQMLKELGIPQYIIDQGDDAIRKYAQDHNIDLPKKEQR